jgi:hypothetical protein
MRDLLNLIIENKRIYSDNKTCNTYLIVILAIIVYFVGYKVVKVVRDEPKLNDGQSHQLLQQYHDRLDDNSVKDDEYFHLPVGL